MRALFDPPPTRTAALAAALTLAALGAVLFAQLDPAAAQIAEVTQVASCRGGHGRIDTTIVNRSSEPATYRVEVDGQRARQATIKAGDWARLPLTKLADDDYVISVRHDGETLAVDSLAVSCGDESTTHGAEVTPIVACRNGDGFVLVQLVNGHAEPRPYVISFDGVRNRSATVAPHGAAVRSITGRPDGVHQLTVRSGADTVAALSVEIECDRDLVAIPERVTVAENTSTVLAAHETGAITWSIAGGIDGEMFGVDAATGALRFTQPPDHERPLDADQDNHYVVDVAATGPSGATATGTVTVEVADQPDTTFANLPHSVKDSAPVLHDADGNALMWWYDSGLDTTMLLRCDDPTCQNDTPVALAITEGDVLRVTYNSSDNPVVLLAHDADDDYRTPAHFSILTCFVETCAVGLQQHVFTADLPMHVEFLLGHNDNPLVVYDQPSTGELMLLACPTRDCSSAAPRLIAQREEPVAASLVLDDHGNPHIGFLLPYPQRLGLLSCTNPTCAGDDAVLLPKASTDLGLYVDHAVDDEGRAFVTWTGSTGNLWLLSCSDRQCSNDVPRVVTEFDHAHEQVAISLNADGLPTLLAESLVFDEIRLLACTNRTCTDDIPTRVLERPGYAVNPTVAHDAVGNPTVAWTSIAPAGVVLVGCADPSCVGDPDGPIIDGSTIFTVREHIVGPVGVLAATALDEQVTWALTGRTDRSLFTVDTRTGALEFIDPPDFERPRDSDLNNLYVIQATATTARGQQVSTTIRIQVIDEDREPTVSVLDDWVEPSSTRNVTIMDNGQAIVVYHDAFDAALKLSSCTPSDCDAPSAVTLPGGDSALFGSIASGDGQRFAVAWIDYFSATLKLLSCGDASCDGAQPVEFFGNAGHYAMAIGPDNLPVIAQEGVDGPELLSCANLACTEHVASELMLSSAIREISIEVSDEGHPVITSRSASSQRTELLACTNTTCAGDEPVTIGDAAHYSITHALKPDGTPTIAFMDAGRLHVLSCTTATCAGDEPVLIESPPFQMETFSLTLADGALPVIAYTDDWFDNLPGHLWVMTCTGTTCDGDEPHVVAAAVDGERFWQATVDVGPNNKPAIVHFEVGLSNPDLLLLECGDPTCMGDPIP